MANHDWTQENLDAYLAGGLSPKERGDLEQHLTACDECAQALADSRKLEQTMDDLFANTRPDAELEERALANLRKSRMRRASILRFVAAAAAVLVVGLLGGIVQVIAFGELPGAKTTFVAQDTTGRSPPVDLMDDSGSVIFKRKVDAKSNGDNDGEHVGGNGLPGNSDGREQLGIKNIEDLKTGKSVLRLRTETMAPHAGAPRVDLYSEGLGETYGLGWTPMDSKHVGNFSYGHEPSWRGGTNLSVMGGARLKKEVEKLERVGAGVHDRDKDKGKDVALGKQNMHLTDMLLTPEVNDKKTVAKDYYRGVEPAKAPPADGPPTPQEKNDSFTTVGQKIGSAAGGDKKVEEPPVNFPALQPKEDPADKAPKIIYTGEMEFEVESFDLAVKKVTELIADRNKGKKDLVAFTADKKSQKQQNGKQQGHIVVRIQPELLEKFIDDLRTELGKFGDLRTQRISSQDVTMQYTDTASELRAARAVETSLLKIIETKKGDIKDLVAAEATLGTWRTTIEKLEGRIRYLGNQISLSTLTITLTEKDIGTPAALVVTEKVTMRMEVDDVKKAISSAVEAVKELKGRVLKAETKQHKAGQFEAILHAEVPPAQKDAFAKKLAALGIISDQEATQKTLAEGGSGKPGEIKPRVNDVVFEVTLNNIVNIQPRQSITLDVATADVAVSYMKFKEELAELAKKAKIQVRSDNLNEQDKLRITAVLDFNVPADKKDAVDKLIASIGPVLKKTSVQAAITEIATTQKYGYTLSLYGPASVAPREIVTLRVEVKDVDKRVAEIKESVKAVNGRVTDANVVRAENGQVSAVMVIDVPIKGQDLIVLKVKEAGNLLHQQATRNPNVPENEYTTARIEVALSGVFAGKQPREKVWMSIEVADVDKTSTELKEMVRKVNGRVADGNVERKPNGQVTTVLVFDVPLSSQESIEKQIRSGGKELSYKTASNTSVPDNELANAQINVTLTVPGPIVPSDAGVGSFMRRSLNLSFSIFAYCIMVIIAGLSFLVPVGGVIFGVFKGIRWVWPGESSKPTSIASVKPAANSGGDKPAANP